MSKTIKNGYAGKREEYHYIRIMRALQGDTSECGNGKKKGGKA